MGSYADVKINNHEILSWKNTFDEWYFTKQDRVREVTNDEKSDNFIGYRVDVKTLRRRLQLNGYDLHSAQTDFEEMKATWIVEMKESLNEDPSTYDLKEIENIKADLKVVETHGFDDWLRVLPRALTSSEYHINDGLFPFKVHIENEPLLSFMLSDFYSVYDDNQGYSGSTFPCKYVETYAIVLLEICLDENECVLDITDLVNGGWVNDFEDISQVQLGKTHFYEHFNASLEELSTLNVSSENATLQRMVFASVITAMEAYLSDTIKCHVLNRNAIKRRFVESHLPFKEKLAKKDVFSFLDDLDKTLNNEIDRISFHNIDTVKDLYKKVLLCEFPEEKLSELRPLVLTRHDIVHRNGKKTDGYFVNVSQQDVISLIVLVREAIKEIDLQIIDGMLVDS